MWVWCTILVYLAASMVISITGLITEILPKIREARRHYKFLEANRKSEELSWKALMAHKANK